MSYTTSLIAARATPQVLRDAVLRAWPELHVVDESPTVQNLEEFDDWSRSRRSRAHDTKAFYQDGQWAVLLDLSMTMCADDGELAVLSHALGRIIIATTQGTAGFAEIIVVDNGVETRRITSVEGELSEGGTPLPEEAGLDLSDFYMAANEEIAHRLGLASFWGEIQPPILAVHVVDSSVPEAPPPRQRPKKSGWKFW